MRLFKPVLIILIFLSLLVFTTCGIEEYYYLPQISQGTIQFNTNARIVLPALGSQYYYATGFRIYYRIYLSNSPPSAGTINTLQLMREISSTLESDFLNFDNFTNPANTATVPTPSTFLNRNYFELNTELIPLSSLLSISGSNRELNIDFPANAPAYITINSNPQQYRLLRNIDNNFTPGPDRYFFNSEEIRNYADSGSGNTVNGDAIGQQSTGTAQSAYVSIYILIAGTNPNNFQIILGKPTHLGIFRLQP